MTRPYAVFLGEVAMDEYYVAPRWPGAGDKVTVEQRASEVGGTVANAASVYAAYGEAVRFLYTLNDSPQSDLLCRDLEAAGIDTSQVSRVPGLPDSKTVIVLSEGEHTIFIPSRGFETIELSAEAAESLRRAQLIYSTPADVRMVRAAGAGARELLSSARRQGARLALDLDVGELEPGDEELIEQADVVFVNAVGAEVLRRMRGPGFAEDLLASGVRIVVVTRAGLGCTVHTPEGEIRVAGIEVSAVDVTGAGDTFCSSFCYALTRSDDLELVAEFANAAAARSVTVHGPRGGVASAETVLAFARRAGRLESERAGVLLPAPRS